MNHRVLISQLLRSPWFIDINHADSYLQLADNFLSRENVSLEERTINIQFSTQGVVTTKQFRNQLSLSDTFKDVAPDTVAIIPINGALTKYDVCGWYGMQSLAALVLAAGNEKNISSVILLEDSPGGSADGSIDLASAVEIVKQLKPVVSYVDGLCASACYRVACKSSYIMAKPGSLIGSIGTMISLRFNDAQLEAAGIKEVVITATESVDKNNDYLQAKIGNYKPILESVLDPLNQQFISEVKASRNVDSSTLTGKVYFSDKAKELNLIDGEGMLSDAIALAEQLSQNFPNNTNMSTPKLTLGQKIMNWLNITDANQQLTDAHAQSLEQLATENETNKQTITTQKVQIDAIQALFPGKTDLVAAVTEVQEKATKFDAANGGEQHRLDKNEADGATVEKAKTEQEIIDALPHNQDLINSPFSKLFN